MSPKFQVYKDAAGKFRFRLRADNNKIVAVGEAYEEHSSCINGVRSVQKNCNSHVEDLTMAGQVVSHPKYQVFNDASGEFRFHLKASNGEIIAQSEGYKTKEDCLNGIEVVRKSCDSAIEDQTAVTDPPEAKTGEAQDKNLKSSSLAPADRSAIVFVGNKMPMDYVLAIVTGLSSSKSKHITLKARGQAITTAVDAAEIARRRFLRNLKVARIAIGTEQMPPREGESRPRMVSTIEIELAIE
jgi:DNA-binding protein Alba